MKKKKIFSSIFTLVLLLSMSTICYATSYSTGFEVRTQYSGPSRYYDGVRINYSAQNTRFNKEGNFELSLIKVNSDEANDFCGSRTMNRREWQASETWANITSGNYYFYFSKSNDGYWITGTGVQLSSSN